MTLFIAGLFSSLSAWQFYRLSWKNKLIQDREESLNLTPERFDPQEKILDGRPVLLEGDALPGVFVPIYKARNGKVGFDIYVFFKINDGPTIALLMGWTPSPQKIMDVFENPKTIKAYVRVYCKPFSWTGFFDDRPKTRIQLDLDELSKTYHLSLEQDFYAVMIGAPPNMEAVPLPPLHNNHLMYALTWLTLFLLTLFTGLRLYVKG